MTRKICIWVIPAGNPVNAGALRTKDSEPEVWGTESFELYLSVDGNLYRFAGNVAGGYTEWKNNGVEWNGKWDSSARILSDRWEVVMKIPFATIQCDINKNNRLKGTFIREYPTRPAGAPREYSSWDGGTHHQTNTFGAIMLMK